MTVVTYSGPGVETYRSTHWVVKVNGSAVYVYELTVASQLNTLWYSVNDDVSVALVTVATDEAVTITVEPVFGDPDIESVRVYPDKHQIVPTVSGGTCTFTLQPAKELLLDINNPADDANTALLFIRSVPPQTTPVIGGSVIQFNGSQTEAVSDQTLVFPQGVWTIGQNFRINSRANVFLHGNAWVKGNFEMRGSVDISLKGHGNWSGEDFDQAAIRLLAYADQTEYSAIYGVDLRPGGDNDSFAGNVIEGPAAWHPGWYSINHGLTRVDYAAVIAPWWYNANGFDLVRDISDGYEASASHVLSFTGDDNIVLERNYDHYELRDCFILNAASASFHLSYWPLATEFIDADTGIWYYDCTALSLAIWDEATETGSIVRLQLDGTIQEGEAGFNRSNIFFDGLYVDGAVSGNWVQIVNKLYQWGAQDQARGSAEDIEFKNCVLENAPETDSRIRGFDRNNTPHNIRFLNCTIGGDVLSVRNHATYFTINEFPYNIQFGGRPVTTAVDVCNIALGLIGNKAKVTTIDPPDGSAEAAHCLRLYPQALRAVLEMHNWSFAKRKRVLTVVNADPDDTDDPAWGYRYQLPDDWVKVISILNEDATDDYMIAGVKQPVDFDIHYSETDEEQRLYTDQEDAWMRYIYYEDDPNQWSHLFIQAVTWHLASMLAGPIIKGDQGHAEAQRCLQRMGQYLGEARIKDSNERQATVERKAAWIRGR